jgi:transmembrane sensor
MASEERIWLLISRAVSGDISPLDLEELESIFQDQPELRADYENLKRLQLIPPGILSTEERRAMERGIDKFNNSLSHEASFMDTPIFTTHQLKPLNRKNNKVWFIAASIISLLMVSAYTFHYFKSIQSKQQQELVTQFGKRIRTILPDGSTVWLNAGSSVKYADNLVVDGKREVILNGEAYFDIKHDVKHPFIVHAGKLNIVVLGTAFNVKAYADEDYIETTLIRGKVEILNNAKPGSNIILYPNEKVSVSTNEYTIKKIQLDIKKPISDSVVVISDKITEPAIPDNAIIETGWVSDNLTFKKEDFTELAKQLERWYNVKIVFDNDAYLSKQFTGTFKNQDINEVMRALQLTQSFHYAITNNQIHIW